MKYAHWDLGVRPAGSVVEVTLQGTEANVRLMTTANFNAFKAGRQHRYHGRHAKQSPVHLTVPTTDHWYVTVDLGGFAGEVQAAVSVS